MSLQEIYKTALERGPITKEVIEMIVKENEELGESLHINSLDNMALSIRQGQPLMINGNKSRYISVIDGIAVARLYGPIFPRANMMTQMSGATSITSFINELVIAYNDSAIEGILIESDSPGGDVRMIGESAQYLYKMSKMKKKPINAYASGYFASAAYHFGSAAQNLYGNKSSETGSIGVVLTGQKKDNNTVEIVSSISPNKRPDTDTEEGRSVLQQRVDDLAAIMVADIEKHRGLKKGDVEANYGKGSVLAGPRAKDAGLLDGLVSSIGQAIDDTKKAARDGFGSRKQKTFALSAGEEFFADALADLDTNNINSNLEEIDMSLKDKIIELLGGDNKVEGQSEEQEAQTNPPVPTREELEDKYASEAALFAQQQVLQGKVYPTDQAQVLVEYLNAKIDDITIGGKVSMVGKDKKIVSGTREQTVRSKYALADKHSLQEESVAAVKNGQVQAHILKEEEEDSETVSQVVSEERKVELLSKTEAGRAVLREKGLIK